MGEAGWRRPHRSARRRAARALPADSFTNNLAHIQALSSGPYASPGPKLNYGGTHPVQPLHGRGLRDEAVCSARKPLRVSSSIGTWRISLPCSATIPALFAMTASGEGDHFRRSSPDQRCVSCGPKNRSEPPLFRRDGTHSGQASREALRRLPSRICLEARPLLLGIEGPAEYDIGVYFKFLQMAGMYLAEGSWPPIPATTRSSTSKC